jgi:hypothetical protein
MATPSNLTSGFFELSIRQVSESETQVELSQNLNRVTQHLKTFECTLMGLQSAILLTLKMDDVVGFQIGMSPPLC